MPASKTECCDGVRAPALHSDDQCASSEAMRRRFLGLITLSLLWAGCAGPRHAVSGMSGSLAPEPYVRIASTDSNHVALQIAAREFVSARRGEPVVWLAGVSHIGESNY